MRAAACETERVHILPLETWVSIGTLLTVALGLAVFMRTMLVDLGGRIDSVRTELGERIDRIESKTDETRSDLGGRIDRLDSRVATLDDRVYALAVGMRPLLEKAEKPSARTKSTRTA
jgi:hypothetical protein